MSEEEKQKLNDGGKGGKDEVPEEVYFTTEFRHSEKYKVYVDNFIQDFKSTVFRQTMFSEFEDYAFKEIEKGNILTQEKLDNYYGDSILSSMEKEHDLYPNLIPHFKDWLIKYTNIDLGDKINNHCKNSVVYDINSQNDYRKLFGQDKKRLFVYTKFCHF